MKQFGDESCDRWPGHDEILPFSAPQKSSSLQTGEPDKPTGYRNGVLQWDDDSTSLHGWEMVV